MQHQNLLFLCLLDMPNNFGSSENGVRDSVGPSLWEAIMEVRNRLEVEENS